MGLKPGDFLDFVQKLVTNEKKQTPFANNRPGYDWYYAFMRRNSHIVEMRTETPLETCRAKLTKEKTDKWYSSFREFLSLKGLIDKPTRIWNADETGFSMGSTSGKVIGPTRAEHPTQVPHLSGGHSKQRLTVMFCGSADGTMMPPFFVYPEPKPRGYNPMTGALYGSDIAYTKKGWMDAPTFEKFLDHFHKYAGEERPVLLLIDSVSSHISSTAFELASKRGIELYRIVVNATHLMQPLDVGVFGPLKQRWHQVVRTHTRNSPGTPISKENFAEKLKEAFLLFYKPLTIINAFRSSGIYPVDSNVITKEQVKPGITFSSTESASLEIESNTQCSSSKSTTVANVEPPHGPSLAFQALESALTTPTKAKYAKRLEEGYDIQGQSPCFDVYKKLLSESRCETVTKEPETSENATDSLTEETLTSKDTAVVTKSQPAEVILESDHDNIFVQNEQYVEKEPVSGLDLLASAASLQSQDSVQTDIRSPVLSPILKVSLTFPSAEQKTKPKRKSQLENLPDNLTSSESLRSMSLKSLSKIRAFKERELKAKRKYMSQLLKQNSKTKAKSKRNTSTSEGSSSSNLRSAGKRTTRKNVKQSKAKESSSQEEDNVTCMRCHIRFLEERELGVEHLWVQCDLCDQWLHTECSEDPVVRDDDFYCYKCEF
jgi:hypothetical protein